MRGFTVIEFLIVIAISIVLAAAAAPLYGNLQISAQLNENSSQIIQSIRTARERSLSGFNNQQHGVFFDINVGVDSYTLYQGASYETRQQSYDRQIIIDELISFSSSDFIMTGSDIDINFSKGLGVVDNTGILTLTHSINGSRSIVLNSMGKVEEN